MEDEVEGVESVVDGTKFGVPLDECRFLLSRGLGLIAPKTFVKVLFDVSFIISLSPTIVGPGRGRRCLKGRLCLSRHSGLVAVQNLISADGYASDTFENY
jgi:hypothetical protein